MDENTIQTIFPGAMVSSIARNVIVSILDEEGFQAQTTLFASSVCADEICHQSTSMGRLLQEIRGDCFQMGGLGGVPSVGTVGFNAFTSHAPDSGDLLIFYASHVGLSTENELGKYDRYRQKKTDVACGAAIKAYNLLENAYNGKDFDEKLIADQVKSGNEQFRTLVEGLKPWFKKIRSGTNVQRDIALASFEIASDRLRDLYSDYKGRVVICGGVQINASIGVELFQLRKFKILHPDGKTQNLLPKYARNFTHPPEFFQHINHCTLQLFAP